MLKRINQALGRTKDAGERISPGVNPAFRSLLGLPDGEYQLLVEPLLQKAKTLDQSASGEAFGLFQHRLQKILRLREGYILPIGAAPEQVSRMHAAYSYALLTAVIVEWVTGAVSSREYSGDSKGYPLLLATRFVPDEGLAWLNQYRQVAMDWCDFFVAPDKSSLREIQRKALMMNSVAEMKTTETKDDAGESQAGQGADNAGMPQEATKTPLAETKPAGPKGLVFVKTLREAISEGSVSVDQSDSMVYTTAQGAVFLRAPEIFHWYEGVSGVAAKTAQNQFNRLGITERNGKGNYFKAQIDGVNGKVNGLVVRDMNLLMASRHSGKNIINLE